MSRNLPRIFVLLLTLTVTSIAGPIIHAQAKPPLKYAIMRQENRNEYVRFEAVIDALDIRAGMSILDIGSGPGYASFLFAEKLRGTGEVFATDIREDFVNHIADEAKRRGFANLHPVVVKPEGLDDFYSRHRYDLVFLSNVYHCLDNRIDYFGKLREFLKPDARLVLVLYNQVPLFSADDFSNVDGLIVSVSMQPEDDPFYKRLSTRTKQLLKEHPKSKDFEKALVDDFNRMLVDPRFFRNFYSNSYFRKDLFTPPEREFANWLLMTLQDDGALDKPVDQLDAKAMRTVIKLNRLLFAKRFGALLAGNGWGAYIPAGDANRHTSKYTMLRELDAAGYGFVKEIAVSPYFDAIIMAPRTR